MLRDISVPFGKGSVLLRIPENRLISVTSPRPAKALTETEFRSAIDRPVGTTGLAQIVRPGGKAAIVVDDYTRPTPTAQILPIVLSELRKGGVSFEDIVVVIGGGLHIPTAEHEKSVLVGEEVVRHVEVVSHICDDDSSLVDLGSSSRGTPIKINRRIVEADFRICIGLIEPHQKAGFSGGAKSIVPGVAGRETINRNHSMRLPIREAIGRIEGNPVRADMEEIARKVGVDFIVNAVLNDRKEVVDLVAGDLVDAHRKGVDSARRMMEIEIPREAEILILSPGGHPRDINLWQTEGKGLVRAWTAAKKGSEIIVVAECPRGVGDPRLEDWLSGASPDEIHERFRREGYTLIGEKAARLADLSEYAKLTFCSPGLDSKKLSRLTVSFTNRPQEQLDFALRKTTEDSSVLVIPNAPAVLIKTKS